MKKENHVPGLDKPKSLYLVSGPSGCKLHIWAASSDQAKRAYCREYEISRKVGAGRDEQ